MGSRFFLAALIFTAQALLVFAQDLTVGSGDLWVSQGADGGYHLYIRKKPDIGSILLVETTRDPSFTEPNYAYRTNTWNAINGNELRIIDGQLLPQQNSWSLIDSTPEFIPELGTEVFHIYIPYVIYYGYPWARNGELYVGNGSYFNIRAFNFPYGDYQGSFRDNPFILEITQDVLDVPEEKSELNYMQETADFFDTISRSTGGLFYHSTGPDDIAETINRILAAQSEEDLDIIICLDTTASMRNDITAMRMKLVSITSKTALNYKSLRVGMVLYRDYRDAYVTRLVPFTSNMETFQKTLNDIQAAGGGDIPEAVHEALYDAVVKFSWRDAGRIIILIGDAPPHPEQRGDITEEMVINAAQEKNIRINTLILPQ